MSILRGFITCNLNVNLVISEVIYSSGFCGMCQNDKYDYPYLY